MKKLMSMVIAAVLIFSMSQTVKAEETQSRFFSISEFNEKYSNEDFLSLDEFNEKYANEGFLSLDEFNEKYANEDFLSLEEFNKKYSSGESPVNDGAQVPMLRDHPFMAASAQQVKTEPIILYYRGIRVGRITLKYKTWIQGGRPQFVYDSCYLGNPIPEGGWILTDANVTYAGDKITVYIECFSGSDHDTSWVYFTPY